MEVFPTIVWPYFFLNKRTIYDTLGFATTITPCPIRERMRKIPQTALLFLWETLEFSYDDCSNPTIQVLESFSTKKPSLFLGGFYYTNV